MKQNELQELITKHTTDDGINIESLNADINTNFDAVIDRKVSKASESAKPTILNDFIKAYDFENVDQFSAFVKNSKAGASELTETVARLQSERDEYEQKFNNINGEYTELKHMSKLSNIDDKYKKFVLSEIRSQVNDDNDFESVYESYVAENPQFLGEKPPVTTKPHNQNNNSGEVDGFEAEIKRRHPDLKLE